MPTLYRKYRPQTFAEVAGQEPIKMTLSFEITANRLAHAYLFCGPRAIGKTTMARLLAKSVNCQKRKKDSADPCNECPSCLEITQGNSLDISEIDAASHTGVDNVRDSIIAAARIAPSRSTYKVFIIDEAHMLSTAPLMRY
jgi:DNA polymerase-3 subunit gamma/tau